MKITPLVNLASATTVLFACFDLWNQGNKTLAIFLPLTYFVHLWNTARHYAKRK